MFDTSGLGSHKTQQKSHASGQAVGYEACWTKKDPVELQRCVLDRIWYKLGYTHSHVVFILVRLTVIEITQLFIFLEINYINK